MRVLEDAIRRGVPVFNDGHHHECAEIYMAACQMIGDSGSDEMPHGVVSALQKTVARAKRMHHAGSRAWTLRHGMDSALAGLRQMSLANVGGDSR
jgi:hypothetical protein